MYTELAMAYTNIDLDEALVQEALRLSGCRSKKEVVHVALQDFVRRKKRKEILELEGKVQWEGNVDKWRRGRSL